MNVDYICVTANRHNLNKLWTVIKETLNITANKTVSYSYRFPDDALPKPKSLITCFSALTKLNHILLKFRTKYLIRSLWPDDTSWLSHKVTIQQLITKHHLDPAELPPTLSADNVHHVKKQLLTMYKLIYHKARLEQRIIEQTQIQRNLQLRCTNYDDNLTRMIDSILNRER